ncbi:unnamed protein product [Urochloa humidicola]
MLEHEGNQIIASHAYRAGGLAGSLVNPSHVRQNLLVPAVVCAVVVDVSLYRPALHRSSHSQRRSSMIKLANKRRRRGQRRICSTFESCAHASAV